MMTRVHRSAIAVALAGLSMMVLPTLAPTAAAALPNTTSPTLTLNRTIRTTPFVGTNDKVRDNEGPAFVPNDPAHPNIGGTDSLWVVEDNGHAAWEIDPYTGVEKSSIRDATWQATRQYSASTGTGSGATAGSKRDVDIEAAAYDRATDTLYVFSGPCCKSGVLPTAYRLKRGADHTFHPEAFQPLPSGSDYTAAAWNSQDHKLYVGVSKYIRTYDFPTNNSGSTFTVSGVSSIYGMSFSDDGNDLFVASKVKLLRADWNAKKLMTGWSIDLKPFGMLDSRSVELIHDQFYIGDGYDYRSSTDPLNHAVFVFDVCCGSGPPPTASFTSTQLASPTNTIQFTDTSTNSPNAWAWDFDNNGTTDSTAQNPQHTYPAPGDYTVKLTATNGGGSNATTQAVHVAAPAAPTAAFTYAAAASPPNTVNFTDTSTGGPTSWAWDFDNNGTTDSTAQNPQHTYPAPGDYTVKLTATNGGGSSATTASVTVNAAPTVITLNPVADSYVSASASTKNYSSYTSLKLKANDGTYEYHPYFQFSVAGLGGAAPTSAKLRLYVTDSGPSGGNWFMPIDSWTESGITWTNAPALTGSPFTTAGAITVGQWIEIDVTSQIAGDGTYTFAATSASTSTAAFASRESATPPQLVITR